MEWLQLVTQGYTLVTPTSRLARYLQFRYTSVQIQQGKKTWETPDILPWNAWLQKSWDDITLANDTGLLLLSTQQQLLIWQEIIGKSSYASGLLHTAATARQVMQAWQLCRQWEIPVFPQHVYLNEDAFAFRQWVAVYQQRCNTGNWIDEATLPEQLITTGIASVNKKIALAGFDDFTPQQRTFINKLVESGIHVEECQLQKRNLQVAAQMFADVDTEIRAAAIWARQLLEKDASASIGIVVHNLQSLHQQISNIFDDVFLPGAILAGAETVVRPYSVAPGLPLARYPLIDTAMIILGLGRPDVLQQEFSSLLRSPFTGDADAESQQRAKLDASLGKYSEYKITFDTLHWLVKNEYIKPAHVPESFIRSCDEFRKVFQKDDKKQPASEWAKLFAKLLKIFNWPGDRPLNSAEYQTVAEWQKLLNEFATLDQIVRTLTYREALAQLRQLLLNTRFQPETQEVPVQILGMNAAAGMQFDHLWIMNLHEEVWPPAAEPNPFIPLALQRDRGMPETSAENKLAQSTIQLQRLIDSSPDVFISCPENEKERQLRPSPLIKPYLLPEPALFESATYDYHALIQSNAQLEVFADHQAPAIPAGVKASGGTALFRDQAACPFRAFARHRLYADGLKSREIGLDALDRGSMIHVAMEKLWQKLGSHANLTACSNEALDQFINVAVMQTVNEFRKKFPLTFTARFMQLESSRLNTLIHEYLGFERERLPFTVKESEQWHRFAFNDIEIMTRIDRIDQLEDGRYVIIDYKTGGRNTKPAAWLGERPEEPQLPLYAIASEGNIAAIVFTKLRRGDIGYTGLAQEDGLLPGVTTADNTRGVKDKVTDWDELFAHWKDSLSHLADGFRKGDASVDPRDATVCNQCDLHAFCRIYEQLSVISSQEPEYE